MKEVSENLSKNQSRSLLSRIGSFIVGLLLTALMVTIGVFVVSGMLESSGSENPCGHGRYGSLDC